MRSLLKVSQGLNQNVSQAGVSSETLGSPQSTYGCWQNSVSWGIGPWFPYSCWLPDRGCSQILEATLWSQPCDPLTTWPLTSLKPAGESLVEVSLALVGVYICVRQYNTGVTSLSHSEIHTQGEGITQGTQNSTRESWKISEFCLSHSLLFWLLWFLACLELQDHWNHSCLAGPLCLTLPSPALLCRLTTHRHKHDIDLAHILRKQIQLCLKTTSNIWGKDKRK